MFGVVAAAVLGGVVAVAAVFFTLASSVAMPSNRRSDAPNYKIACEHCGQS